MAERTKADKTGDRGYQGKIAKCKSAWEAEEWDYYTAGRSEAYRDALIIIDEHIGKEKE